MLARLCTFFQKRTFPRVHARDTCHLHDKRVVEGRASSSVSPDLQNDENAPQPGVALDKDTVKNSALYMNVSLSSLLPCRKA